ncbi:MAG: response regulator [Treponema sp.]|nr:response regulator [Treponema sp.]
MDIKNITKDFDEIIRLCNESKEDTNNTQKLNKIITSVINKAQELKTKIPSIQETESTADIPDLSNFHILLAEDNNVNMMVAEAFMKKTGCKITCAENGLVAVEKYKASLKAGKPYDLVFLDMQMPVMDGFVATKDIRFMERGTPFKTPIIALTGNVLDSEIKKAENLGTNDYITKPFSASLMYEKSARLLGVTKYIKNTEIKKENETLEVKAKSVSNGDYPDFSALNFLVVDDNKLNVEILNLMLKKAEAKYEDAYDGTEALEKFLASEQNHFDMILMDIQMPEMDGNTCAEKIRESGRSDSNLPIIAISANAFQEDKEKSLKAGINYHMSKPVNMKKLFEKITEILKL